MKKIKFDTDERKIHISEKINFTIESSITKAHFKMLMKLAHSYNSSSKSGFIKAFNKEVFLKLVNAIESTSDEECIKSHELTKSKLEKRISSYKKKEYEQYHEDIYGTRKELL